MVLISMLNLSSSVNTLYQDCSWSRVEAIQVSSSVLELTTAWIVILWRFAAICVCAKHIGADSGAEMLNSNSLCVIGEVSSEEKEVERGRRVSYMYTSEAC